MRNRTNFSGKSHFKFGCLQFLLIEMQRHKGPGNKKFCTIHSRSSLDLVSFQ